MTCSGKELKEFQKEDDVMMISPQMYIDEVKDYPYEKLIEERNKLVDSIMRFEKSYFAGDRSGDEWHISPSPEVVYQCELEYLSELCDFMQERFNTEYIWGGES